MWRSLKCIRKKIEGREGGSKERRKEGRKWKETFIEIDPRSVKTQWKEHCIWKQKIAFEVCFSFTWNMSLSLSPWVLPSLIIPFELLNPIAQIFPVFLPSFSFSIALVNIWYTMCSWPFHFPLLECKLIEGTDVCFVYYYFLVSKRVFDTSSDQIRSVAHSCPTLCDPMNRSTPGLPVHHQLPEFLRLTSIESVMPSSHLILCHPLLLLPPIPPSIRVFSNESTLHMR